MSTDGLVEFVEARLADDERIAREVEQRGPWAVSEYEGSLYETDYGVFALGPYGGSVVGGEHVVRHDPARVLRDVAAKRRLLALAKTHLRFDEHHPSPFYAGFGETMLISLAAPFADHPDYSSEWSPA